MLIVEVNGTPGTAHPAARLFIEEGFLPTAMGLQARVPPGPHGHGPSQPRARGGTGIAETTESTPTDPDSPDADINCDDMIDES